MSRLRSLVALHGWTGLPGRLLRLLLQRARDRRLARKLRAPGFRVGRHPRLLGTEHIAFGPDFHARDFVWIEAVTSYDEAPPAAPFTPQLRIGASARLSDNVHIACLHRVSIGDHLLCGSRVLISDHAHGSYSGAVPRGSADADLAQGIPASDPAVPPARRPLTSRAPVVIGHNVWLGDGVAVLAGAVIGDGCVLGANSVVTGTIPAGTVAVGSPARPIRRWDAGSRAWLPIEAA